jgi:cell division protein FtsB
VSPRTLGVTALVLAAVVSVGFGGQSLTRVWQIKGEVETLERQISSLRAENAQLQAEVAQLRSDPAAIEKLAREKLGFVKPGERVFKLPPTPGGQ